MALTMSADALRRPPGFDRASRNRTDLPRRGMTGCAELSALCAVSELDATITAPVDQWRGEVMDVQFITSVAVITADPGVSRKLYVDALGLPLTAEGDGYLHSEDIDGSKSFGVWPLTQAAQACFGTPDWPAGRPVPQASIEFEVADADTVQVAADELKQKGFTLLHDAHTEPWGQTVARLQSSDGAIIGLSYAPWMHT
jgi:catechol 2,3-dioxygenase-like lactoylglutathione lyase family enzyme